ncbi:hypothetical protein [Janibacter sp. LM]|uniref:hypothetical protein n=1 Tax=Janibacter sp. LM TaxID=3144845 RepID=UPI0031F6F874
MSSTPQDPPTRPGIPLRDRPVAGADVSTPATSARRTRHCWVRIDGERFEGLVLQWAQDERGWVALVVFVQPRPGGDVTVQQWVPASDLQPVRVAE